MKSTGAFRRALWLLVFSTAMGVLESIVVVYLRALYYPSGFEFPLMPLPPRILAAELIREGATLVMLLAVAFVAGSDRVDRFFVFGLLFGSWDLIYYLGLLAFLGWPPSPWTWDLLFLIPVPWLAPVFYPALVSVLLIVGFAVHEAARARGRPVHPSPAEWAVSAAGSLAVVITFCWNWRVVEAGHVPERFPAAAFAAALTLGVVPIARASRRALLPRMRPAA